MNLKKLFFLPLIILALIVSCQKEETDITNPDQEETIVSNSSTARLMSRTATNDGSSDNIIDFANCLEVVLPVTVSANGITVTIESSDDFVEFEDLLDTFGNNNISIDISFPITVILSDYTEIVISSQQELDAQIGLCNGENEEDDDIECIDFQYPISLSIYNLSFQIVDTVIIQNDEALYGFIGNLNGEILAGLNFPVTMVLSDGSTVIVNSNQELEDAILSAENDCDEDDDYDWNDDDDFDCPNLLANVGDYCQTGTVAFGIVNENCNCVEDTSPLSCLQGETIVKCDENNDGFEIFNLYEGLSEISGCTSNNQVQVSYHETTVDAENNTNPLSSVTSYTNITSIQTIYVRVQLLNNPNQFNVLEIELILEDCSPLSCLQGGTIVKCDENNDGFEIFNLYEGLSEISGCTSNNQVQVSYHETIVDAENNTNPLSSVTSYTNITSIQTIYVRVQLLNNPNQFDVLEIELILEDCSNTTCSEAEISAYVVECIWNVVDYNNTNDLSDYDFDFNADGTVLITGNGQTITSMWSTSTSGAGTIIEFSNVGAPIIQVITGDWLIIECVPYHLEMQLNNDDVMVMEKDCN